ncbi:PIN domain-containing protein [Paenibacillus sp. BAC0078]
MKTYIIFDTNILHRSKYSDYSKFAFPQIYDDIRGKIERYELEEKFEVFVPEITINELFQQQIESFEEIFCALKEKYDSCKQLYGLDLIIKEDFDYRTELEARKTQYLSHNRVLLLPVCSENRFSSIVNRALNKHAPFLGARGNSDKGFKDAVIWESILEFALRNNGEYILITHDKGFKEYLTSEFKAVTGHKIEIINKDEISFLDTKIETLSNEQSIRSKWEAINHELLEEGLLDKLIKFIKSEELDLIEVNGLKCNVAEIHIIKDIIDLNEIGIDSFRFKLKGHFLVDKFAIPIVFEMDIIVVLDIHRLNVLRMELDNIEGHLSSGDLLLININKFIYTPYESNDLDDFEDNSDDISEVVATRYTKPADSIITTDNANKPTVEDNKSGIEIYQKSILNYVDILSKKNVSYSDELVFSLIDVLNENATVDWLQFESKKSRMRLAIKGLLKSTKANIPSLEELVEQITQQAVKDYELFLETNRI